MFRTRLCHAVMAVVMCLGGCGLWSGVAHAQGGLVLSDTIKFSGTLAPAPAGYGIQVAKCKVTSDGETKISCEGGGNFIPNPPQGNFGLQSLDGFISVGFTLLQTTIPNTYKLKNGTGTEGGTPDPGGPQPAPNPVVAKGSVTLNPAASPPTITGIITVWESPTAP